MLALALLCTHALADDAAPVDEETPTEEAAPTKEKDKKKKPSVKVSGYIQVFVKIRRDTGADGTEPIVFRVQRARLKFSGKVIDHVGYDVEIDPRAPLVTGILRDAYITLHVIPHQEFRIGQQKTTFGYENSESSTKLWFVNRSEVADNLMRGNVTLRDIGLGLVGDAPVGDGGFFVEDAITLVNGAGMNVQADDTPGKNVWGRLGVRYEKNEVMVRLGASGAAGDQLEPFDPGPPPVPAFTYTFQRVGGDVEIDMPWVWVASEIAAGRDVIDGTPEPSTGGYALMAVKLPWKVGPLIRFDALGDFRRVTAGAFYGLPSDKVRVLANYEVFSDELGRHDDRFYLWTQARF